MKKSPTGTAMPTNDTETFLVIRSQKGATRSSESTPVAALILVNSGSVAIVTDGHRRRIVCTPEMLLLPAGTNYHAVVQEDDTVITVCFMVRPEIFTRDFPTSPDATDRHFPATGFTLAIKPALGAFAESLRAYFRCGTLSGTMQTIKTQELICLLRENYSREEMGRFLCPALDENAMFRARVLMYCDNVVTAKELANAVGYSSTGFSVRFGKVFGTSPYAWLARRKAERLREDLKMTTLTTSELAAKHGFSSTEHLCVFSKRHLGAPPSHLRGGE